MPRFVKFTRRVLIFSLLSCLFVFNVPTMALSPEQKRVLDSGVGYFNVAEDCEIGGGTALVGGENKEKVWNFLIGKGLTPPQAAGVMGNMQAESGFNPGIVERSGGGGFGLSQWTGGRRTTLEAEAAKRGVPVNDLAFQLNYLYFESNQRALDRRPPQPAYVNTSLKEWVGLTTLVTVRDSAIFWHWYNERSADNASRIEGRVRFATDILVQFGSSAGSPSSVVTTSANCNVGLLGTRCGGNTSSPMPPGFKPRWGNFDAHGSSISWPRRTNGHNTVVGKRNNFGAVSVKNSNSTWGEAVDVGATPGTKVFAPLDGTVLYANTIHRGGSDGFMVIIESSDKKCVSVEAHVRNILVTKGAPVKAGQQIGEIIAISQPHLHFELWVDGQPVNVGGPVSKRSGFSNKALEIWEKQKAALTGGGPPQ